MAGKLQLANSRSVHINKLEILAAGAALESFSTYIRDKPVLLFVDNTTCESLILRGSSLSPSLNVISSEFWRGIADLHTLRPYLLLMSRQSSTWPMAYLEAKTSRLLALL